MTLLATSVAPGGDLENAVSTLLRDLHGTRVLLLVSGTEEWLKPGIVHLVSGIVDRDECAELLPLALFGVCRGEYVVTKTVLDRVPPGAIPEGHPMVHLRVLPPCPPWSDLSDAMRRTAYLYCVYGLSAAEVARELGVSPNTITWRIKRLYQQLGVKNRQDAYAALFAQSPDGE